jgi:archaellum biogenesis protein FlaJ (TadC family)
MNRSEQRSRRTATEGRAVEDVSGYGLLGLTLGIVAGFLFAFYLIVPLFPKTGSTEVVTLMTSVVVALMTVGGGVGYVLSRRSARVAAS